MRNIGYGLLAVASLVSCGCGGDGRTITSAITNEGDCGGDDSTITAPVANEGDFSIRMTTTPPKPLEEDRSELPPMKLWVRAGSDGQLSRIRLDHRSFSDGDWGALRLFIIGVLGDERGPNSLQATAEAVLYCDYRLPYQQLINAITAISGYIDDKDRVVKLIEEISIVPPGTAFPEREFQMDEIRLAEGLARELSPFEPAVNETSEAERHNVVLVFPLDVERGDRVELPVSELARPREDAFQQAIGVELTKSGTIVFRGESGSIDEMVHRLVKQREVMEETGKSPAKTTVIILADKDCPAGRVQELIQTCRRSGFEHIALRAKRLIRE